MGESHCFIGNFRPTYVEVVKNNKKQSNENKDTKNNNLEEKSNNNQTKKVTFTECDGKQNSFAFSQMKDGTKAVKYSKDLSSVPTMILKNGHQEIFGRNRRGNKRKSILCPAIPIQKRFEEIWRRWTQGSHERDEATMKKSLFHTNKWKSMS